MYIILLSTIWWKLKSFNNDIICDCFNDRPDEANIYLFITAIQSHWLVFSYNNIIMPIGNLRSSRITTRLMTSGQLDFSMEEGLEVQHCYFEAWGKTYQFRLWDVTFRVTMIFSLNITFCFYWRMCCLQSTKSITDIYLLDIGCYIRYENKYWKKYLNTDNLFSNNSL